VLLLKLVEIREGARLSSSRSVDVGGALGLAGLGLRLRLALNRRLGLLVLLARAVNRDLNGDLTSLDLLAVHLVASLLLQLLTRESDEAEPTTLAGLVARLQLADHVLRDGTEGDLGGGGRVLGEDLDELLLAQVVRQVGDHDLGLGGDAVLRRATLLARAGSVGLAALLAVDADGALRARLGAQSLVSGLGERSDLAGDVSGATAGGRLSTLLAVLAVLGATAASAGAATATPVAATAAGGLATTRLAFGTLTALSGGSSGLRLAGELHRHLAVEDALAVQLVDGALGLGRGRDVDEGVADGTGGAWVGGDGCRFAGTGQCYVQAK
jgi:hypothetical protein